MNPQTSIANVSNKMTHFPHADEGRLRTALAPTSVVRPAIRPINTITGDGVEREGWEALEFLHRLVIGDR